LNDNKTHVSKIESKGMADMAAIIKLRLEPETRKKLDLLAEASGYSSAALVSEAVRRFVELEFAALATAQDDQPDNGEGGAASPVRLKLIV
jgi:predicted transcriptional regulator